MILGMETLKSVPSSLSLLFLQVSVMSLPWFWLIHLPSSPSLLLQVSLPSLCLSLFNCLGFKTPALRASTPSLPNCCCQGGGLREDGKPPVLLLKGQRSEHCLPSPRRSQFQFPFQYMLNKSVTENHLHWQLQKSKGQGRGDFILFSFQNPLANPVSIYLLPS